MEAAHYSEPPATPLTVQRAAKVAGWDQPEGADRQPAVDGGGRHPDPDGLRRGTAQGGIRPIRAGRIHAPNPGIHADLGRKL